MTARLDTGALARAVASACWVMAATGLVEHVLGHISARLGAEELVVRCRGPQEAGPAYTPADDVRTVSLDGTAELGEWTAPNERPIHTEVLRRRPDVTAVGQAHPPAVVAASLLDTPLLPPYGSYDAPGARLAAGGIPTWPRAALVTTRELAGGTPTPIGDEDLAALPDLGASFAVDTRWRHLLRRIDAGVPA